MFPYYFTAEPGKSQHQSKFAKNTVFLFHIHLIPTFYPPIGLRLRLKQDFDISGFDPHVQVILKAMKKYGLVLSDVGSDMYISGAPDERWDDDVLRTLNKVTAGDFEAVYTGEAIPY